MSAGSKPPLQEAQPDVLVQRIAAGDETAETELVRRYSRSLMTMLEFRSGDVQRAEDVHQDTFCIVLNRIRSGRIDDPSRIAAFIHRTAINVLVGEFRKESRRQTYADTDVIQLQKDENADQLRQLIRKESDDAVRDTLLSLTNERDKEILYRFYILQEEKPVICGALDLSAAHFDRVVSRARKRFRAVIEKRRLIIVKGGAVA